MINTGGIIMMKYYKNAMKFFGKHPDQNGFIHLILGFGLGILFTYPFVGSHPLRWGGLFIAMGLLGHAYAVFQKTK